MIGPRFFCMLEEKGKKRTRVFFASVMGIMDPKTFYLFSNIWFAVSQLVKNFNRPSAFSDNGVATRI
jgi:hypothetical protein